MEKFAAYWILSFDLELISDLISANGIRNLDLPLFGRLSKHSRFGINFISFIGLRLIIEKRKTKFEPTIYFNFLMITNYSTFFLQA